jgi:hypothetical protein
VGTTSFKDLRKAVDDATRPLPKDWYSVVVDKAEAVTAQTGSQMVKTTLKVDEGAHAGRNVWTNFVMKLDSPFALGIFFKNMAAFGLGDAFFDGLTERGLDPEAALPVIADALVGRKAKVEVDIRTWQGTERNECKAFTGIGGQVPASAANVGMGGAPGMPPIPPAPTNAAPPVPPAQPPTPPVQPAAGQTAPVPAPVAPSSAPPDTPF